MRFPTWLPLLALLSTSASPAVFGSDHRVQYRSAPREFWPIGRAAWGGRRTTGTLISRCNVLTARHLLPNRNPLGARVRFEATAAPGRPGAKGRVVAAGGFDMSNHGRGQERSGDWLIVKLDRCIGDQVGTIPLSDAPIWRTAAWSPRPMLMSAGYPSDREGLAVDPTCRIDRISGDDLLHDCATVGGDSGGPLMTRRRDGGLIIVAIHSASPRHWGREFSTATANLAVLTETIGWAGNPFRSGNDWSKPSRMAGVP